MILRRAPYLLLVFLLACGGLATGEGGGAPLDDASRDAADAGPAPRDAERPEARRPGDGARDAFDAGADPLDGLARLCTLAASCGAAMTPKQSLSASDCAETIVGAVPADPVATRFLSCVHALNCASLLRCLGSALILLEEFSPNSGCKGTSIVASSGETYDCAGVGRVCAKEIVGERAYCATKACGEAFTTSCKGDGLESCDDNIGLDSRCVGGTCAMGQCVGSGAACDPAHSPGSCSGSVATSCVGGGLETMDCATQPLRTACVSGQCVTPPSTTPGCLSGNEQCMGDDAVVCVGSDWRTISCTALGFGTCATARSGEIFCRH